MASEIVDLTACDENSGRKEEAKNQDAFLSAKRELLYMCETVLQSPENFERGIVDAVDGCADVSKTSRMSSRSVRDMSKRDHVRNAVLPNASYPFLDGSRAGADVLGHCHLCAEGVREDEK